MKHLVFYTSYTMSRNQILEKRDAFMHTFIFQSSADVTAYPDAI